MHQSFKHRRCRLCTPGQGPDDCVRLPHLKSLMYDDRIQTPKSKTWITVGAMKKLPMCVRNRRSVHFETSARGGYRIFSPVIVAITLVGLIVTAQSRAEDYFPASIGDRGTTYRVAQEFDKMVALLSDDVLRDLVCRLAYERYTPEALGSALNLPTGAILRRLETMGGWGLTRLMPWQGGNRVVEAIPGRGENTLRRWAARYCPLGDACGRPDPNAETPREQKENPKSENAGFAAGAANPVWHRKQYFDRFAEAIKRIDTINGSDPVKIPPDERGSPREEYFVRLRLNRLEKIAPMADEIIKLAVRAYNLARWEIVRESYGLDLEGYRQWRAARAESAADKTARILGDLGFSPSDIKRARNLIKGVDAGSGGESQMLRDIDGAVFFENEFGPLINTSSDLELQNIVLARWTVLSWKGRRFVRDLDLPWEQASLIIDVLVDSGDKGEKPPANY